MTNPCEPLLTLDSLSQDVFFVVAAFTGALGLARLARVSRRLGACVQEAEDAWAKAWARETGGSEKPAALPAQMALRSVTTLDSARWTALPVASAATTPVSIERSIRIMKSGALHSETAAPRWREHACVLSCNDNGMLVLFGGRDIEGELYFNDTWACDLGRAGLWQRVACPGKAPSPRCFNGDAGGGRVLRSGNEEWALIFGGLCQPGHRDNQTWLLGPLNEPPAAWMWLQTMPDEWMGRPPRARFHHTLTVIPRAQATGEGSHDFLVMVGGHNRLIEPILDLHVLSLRDASFDWSDHESLGERRISAKVTWCAQPRQPEPPGRAFHSAIAWTAPWCTDFVVVTAGLGSAALDGDDWTALADTWLFDTSSSTWIELLARLPTARSRASLAIVRGQLVLAGGCRQPTLGNPLAPGAMMNDVWLLNLLSAVEYNALQYSTSALEHPWTRCVLPTDAPECPCRISPRVTALHGGKVLLILGGYGQSNCSDQFGDSASNSAWGLQETQALSFGLDESWNLGIRATQATHAVASCLVSSGAALYPGEASADEVETRASSWLAAKGMHVLVHGLKSQPHLNGAVGTIIDTGPPRIGGADARVGVRLGPPHSIGIKVRRANLQPSMRFGEQPMIAVPDGEHIDALFALTPSTGQLRQNKMADAMRSGIVVRRLSVLPEHGGVPPENDPRAHDAPQDR